MPRRYFFDGKRGARKENPETPITRAIRDLLKLMNVKHFKHFGGPMAERGISDIVGTLPPSGRALFIEVKVPGKKPRPDQELFLAEMSAAGALAFWADSPQMVGRRLAEEGFEPAKRLGWMTPKAETKPAPKAPPACQDDAPGGAS